MWINRQTNGQHTYSYRDRQTDKLLGGWTDGQMGTKTEKWMDGHADKWTADIKLDRQTVGLMDRQTGQQTDRQIGTKLTNGWMDRHTSGQQT